jgi:hypothetical protein
MSVSAGDIVRATAVMDAPAGKVENVYYFRAGTLLDTSEVAVMTDLALKLDTAYGHLAPSMSHLVVFTDVQGYNITQAAPMPTVPWPTQTVGGSSHGVFAPQVSAFGLFRTGVKRAIGRKFFGGIQNTGIDDNGLLSGAVITAVSGLLGELIGSFIASGTLNDYLPGVWRKAKPFLSFIEGVASARPAVQRRRAYGRGV